MKKQLLFLLFPSLILFSACNNKRPVALSSAQDEWAEPDTMVYGLSCDGTNDSVIVFLPFADGADPITYNIEVAKAQGRIIGQPAIGDWVGIMLNPTDTTEATMVVNLDQLKGTWTQEVRPVWKDASKMSGRALRRKMNEIPDSLREAYLVPREYGFTLKRSSIAEPVGRVHRASTLEDDSPVEYPEVKEYVRWKCRNGHLYLTSTDGPMQIGSAEKKKTQTQKETKDTLEFVFMTEDSLVLMTHDNVRLAYHRKASTHAANAAAEKAAEKTSKTKLK